MGEQWQFSSNMRQRCGTCAWGVRWTPPRSFVRLAPQLFGALRVCCSSWIRLRLFFWFFLVEIIAFSAPRSSGSLRSELMPFWVLFGSAGDRWCLDPSSVVSSTHPPHLIVFRDVSRSHNSLRKSTRFHIRLGSLEGKGAGDWLQHFLHSSAFGKCFIYSKVF